MLEVRDEHRALRRATEDAGWVERRHDGSPDARESLAVLLQHAEPPLPGHGPDGGSAEGDDDVPGVRFDITHQTFAAGVDGLGRWPNTGRTAGDRVGDEEVDLAESSRSDRLP
jgi:hypothetical protein